MIYYGDSEIKNHLVSRTGNKPGSFIELVSGIGWHSVQAFAPLTKTMWLLLGSKYGFEVLEGTDLGSIRIDLTSMVGKSRTIVELGCGFMSSAHRLDLIPYGPVESYRDFGVKLKEVLIKFISFSTYFYLRSQ